MKIYEFHVRVIVMSISINLIGMKQEAEALDEQNVHNTQGPHFLFLSLLYYWVQLNTY